MPRTVVRALTLAFAGTVVLTARVAWALSRSDVLLYLPFEGTADARIAAGSPKALVHGAAEFGAGKQGEGYLAGRQGDELLYAAAGNIEVAAGTVAVWVKPLDWGERDAFMRFWFRAGEEADAGGKGEGGTFLWLYKYLQAVPLYWLLQQNYRQTATTCVGAEHAYATGEWTHVVATWCGPVMRLYVNGQFQGRARAGTPTLMRNLGAHLYVGGASWMTNGEQREKPDSVLDELYVFRRPLTSAEVRLLAEKGDSAFSEAGTPPAEPELAVSYFPSNAKLKVNLMVNGRAPGDTDGLAAVLAVEEADGRATEVDSVRCEVRSVDMHEWLEAKRLATGRYRVSAVLMREGDTTPPAFAEFEKPPIPDWLGNTLGVPQAVPAPWTPLRRKRNTVACWNRTVSYRDSLFPRQITSAGKELLARPICLLGQSAGKRVSVRDVVFSWTETTPLRVAFAARAALGEVRVDVAGHLDFDGFIWTQLTVPAAAGSCLERLVLEIPLRADIATLQHGAIGRWAQEPKDGRVYAWNCPVKGSPFVWLGDEDVGLQWASEDDYDWENAVRDRMVELVPGATECLLRVTMIDHAVTVDRPRTYRFGLQPTPVKPLTPHRRAYDLAMNGWWRDLVADAPVAPVTPWRIWFQIWSVQNPYTPWMMGYPVPGPYAWQAIDNASAEGTLPFLYWDIFQVWRGIPEYAAFRSEWDPDNPAALPFDTAPAAFGCARRTVPSFRDWAVWRLDRTLRDCPWLASRTAGFYLDVVQGFWGSEPRTDSQGTVRTRHEWLGTRELQQRLYVLLQEKWPGLLLINHQSSDTHLPELAFAHLYVTGEHYAGNAAIGREGGYYHVMDLDSCRAELAAQKWGVPVIFLPEISSCGVPLAKVLGPEGIPPAEHLAGLLLVHDVIPWSSLANPIPLARLAAIKERFGWDDHTQFIGYWCKDNPVQLQSAVTPVVASVYRRPNKALLAVMNNADEDAAVTAVVDWTRLGITAPAVSVDAYTVTGVPSGPPDLELANVGRIGVLEPKSYLTPLSVPVRDGRLTFSVTRRNFRALLLE